MAGTALDAIGNTPIAELRSAVLSGGSSGSHKIEGIGIGFVPPLWEPEAVDARSRRSWWIQGSAT